MPKLLWTNRSNFGPSPRTGSTACFDSDRGRTVLFGGDTRSPDGKGFLGDTWEWDGAFWTQLEDIGPTPRRFSAMAYDSARKVSLLFGGRDTDFTGDTWQWDGTGWTKVSETGPSARSGHAMAFDSGSNRTVLFAGQSPTNFHLADTWEFDGDTWTQVQDAGPPPRGAHTMAFDPVGKRVVLFGGLADNLSLGDTWSWDGSEWVQIAEFGPPPRLNAAMTSASGSNLLLFGGIASLIPGPEAITFGDTWVFDGKRWTQRQDIGPGPLQNPAMAFDSARSTVVLFGGLLPNPAAGPEVVSGLTWEAPVAPAAPPPAVVPVELRLVSMATPPSPQLFANVIVTFTLNGPASAGGTVVHMNRQLLDENGADIAQFTIPAGQTSFGLTAKFPAIGPVILTAGVQDLTEASLTVVVIG